MVSPFSVLWRSIVDFYNELFPMVGMNLLWMIVTVPFALIFFPIVAGVTQLPPELAFVPAMVFLLIAPNPASAGIHNYANQLVKEERVEFELFKAGLFRYWKRALVLMVFGFLGFALLIGNVAFYLSMEHFLVKALGVMFIYGLVIWGAMQLYLMPLLIEQEDKSIRVLYRNAALLAMDNILVSIVLLLVLLIVSALSVIIPLLVMLLAGTLVALVQHRATLMLLEKYRARGKVTA